MSETLPCQIALLGLGNLMRTDDAVGMLTLCKLEECGRLPPEVRVIEGGTLGLDLLESLRGISHLLVLDAVDTGVIPGTLKRFEGLQVDDLPVSKSVHLLGFSDLMGALRLIDAAPAEVVLLGVQPASTDWGTILTPKVETARYDLMQAALDQLAQWKVEMSETAIGRQSRSRHEQKQSDSSNAIWNTY
jgi:hydrogenase maturation protease